MNSIRRQVTVATLFAAGFLFGKASAHQGQAAAPTRKPITFTRIYAGPEGQRHAEEVEMKLTDRGIAEFAAGAAQFSSRPAGPPNTNWHTGPRRQFVITLSGRAELEVSDGRKVLAGPGHINLIEDTTGKGHLTRNIEDRIVLTIPLADEPGAGGN